MAGVVMKKFAVLINPSSAGGKSLSTWPQYQAALEAQGYKITKHISVSESDFRETAKHFAKRFHAIGICGGDSSLTIAAEVLAACGFSGHLVFLPAGSVNDIILDIREKQSTGTKSAWLGELLSGNESKKFLGQANWGLGVVVNRWVGKLLSTLPILRPMTNLLGFLCIVTAHLLKREMVTGRISTGNSELSGQWSILIVSQIRYWASGLDFFPKASYYAPELEIIAVERAGLFTLIRIIMAAKTGKHLQFPQVKSLRGKSALVEFTKAHAAQIDGDILRTNGAEFVSTEFKISKRRARFRLTSLSP